MKKSLLCSLLLATAVACQKEDPAPEAKAGPVPAVPAAAFPQTWQLVKLTGSMPGVRTGATLPYQETVVFRADSTFLKTRQQGAQVVEARGTFSLQHLPNGRFAVLAYSAASPLLRSCTPNALTERLAFLADTTLVGSSQACDGPRLEYKRVQ